MNTDTHKSSARGHFKNVVHTDDAPAQEWARDTERFGAFGRELALGNGAQELGYALVSLDPGKRSCPHHFHHSEEEMFYVLEGHATLRQSDADGEEEVPIGPGDVIAYPAATGIAHQFFNHTDAPFVYLALSNLIRNDVCEYPDSNKILFRKARRMLRREPVLEYFDGEL